MIRIKMTSVLVDDQEKALLFYTRILGFVKKEDVPLGDARWLTVVSPATDDVELLLEPMGHAAAKPFQKALFDSGVPLTAFAVDDIAKEYERLSGIGVRFTQPPTRMGKETIAVLDDTCGNLIQLYQTE
jgi:catechol 2,3-dioxygenase-like lactoylglutathione lyase family enzyme